MNAISNISLASSTAIGTVVPFNDNATAINAVPKHEPEVIEASGPATALADRKSLTRALDIVANVVEKRHTAPVLSNICLTGDGTNLTVTGTDLDIEISVQISAPADARFAVTLPAHTMKDLLKKATASDFVGFNMPDIFHVEETKHCAAHDEFDGPITVDFERVKYRLPGIPTSEFPTLESGKPSHSFAIPGTALVEAFGGVAMAISTEETRYYLNGVYLHHVEPRAIDRYHGDRGALRMVATDGHRLCRQDIDAVEGSEGMPGIIIPRKTVALLQKLMKGKACPESVRIELSDTKLRLMFDDVTITSKLVDGTFPDYQRVIPSQNDKPATFNAADLAEGIRAVTVISSERGRAVKMTFTDGNCQIGINNPDTGSAIADIATDFEGDEIEIGFNVRYMLDFVAMANGKDITLTMADAGSPTLITTDCRKGWIGVQMPMRV